MSSQPAITTSSSSNTLIIYSKRPLNYLHLGQFKWKCNVEIIAPIIFISPFSVLSASPGRTLSFRCDETFLCLGKIQAAVISVTAYKAFLGENFMERRVLQAIPAQEADLKKDLSPNSETTIVRVYPNQLFISNTPGFQEGVAYTLKDIAEWDTPPSDPEERAEWEEEIRQEQIDREAQYLEIIHKVTTTFVKKKRELMAAAPDCGNEDTLLKRRKFF